MSIGLKMYNILSPRSGGFFHAGFYTEMNVLNAADLQNAKRNFPLKIANIVHD